VTLLGVTGLFVTSFVQELRVDPGFSPDRVVAVEIGPVQAGIKDAKARAAFTIGSSPRQRDLSGVMSASKEGVLERIAVAWEGP
jgi:hypothetical protein